MTVTPFPFVLLSSVQTEEVPVFSSDDLTRYPGLGYSRGKQNESQVKCYSGDHFYY